MLQHSEAPLFSMLIMCMKKSRLFADCNFVQRSGNIILFILTDTSTPYVAYMGGYGGLIKECCEQSYAKQFYL